MRFPRVKAEGPSFYHCVSRVVERRFIFQTSRHGSAEAERFVRLMRRLEPYRRRMYDISIFVKELKGRFADCRS